MMAMESDPEREHEAQPPAKRQKRFKFKKLSERYNDVDVDVYRSLHPVRDEPRRNSRSFFQVMRRT